jgi:hypothetical protein
MAPGVRQWVVLRPVILRGIQEQPGCCSLQDGVLVPLTAPSLLLVVDTCRRRRLAASLRLVPK